MPTDRQVILRPARNVRGNITLPGDKSISHRYAMLAALADGPSRLENYSTGADCASTLGCLRSLGVQWERKNDADAGNIIEVHGSGPALTASDYPLDCGNSGSTIRMLSGIAAAQNFTTELAGDESLSRRPMQRIIAPLTAMGTKIDACDGKPPLRITGTRLKGIQYAMPVASAQVKTSLLFAGLLAHGETTVEEPLRTRDHGELALLAFGATVDRRGNAVQIRGGQHLHGIQARIPGDMSSAAFFLCAAALFPGSQVTITNLLMNPTRARLLDILLQLGLRISVTQLEETHGELVGTAQAEGGSLNGLPSPAPTRQPSSMRFQCWPLSPRLQDRELRCGTRKNCASRNPTASLRSPPIFAPWAPKSKNARMDCEFPVRSGFTAPNSTHSAIIASPWLSASPHCEPKAKPSFGAANALRSLIPRSLPRSNN